MPEFVLPLGDSAAEFSALPAFVRGYIEAAFFTSTGPDNEDEGLGPESSFAELAPEAIADIVKDCARFQGVAAELLALAYARDYDEMQAGRDFWFTRNQCGVGYWDREQLDDSRDLWRKLGSPKVGAPGWDEYARQRVINPTLGRRLSTLADNEHSADLYRGDDGQIYHM